MYPYLFLIIGTICIGISPILVSVADAPGVVSAFLRVCISSFFLLIPYALIKKKGINARLSWKFFSELRLPILGGFFFAINIGIFYSAVLISNPATAVFFANTAVFWVGLLSHFFLKTGLSSRYFAGALIALMGFFIIEFKNYANITTFNFGKGDIFAIISGFFYASYLVTTKISRQKLDTYSYNLVSNIFSSIALYIYIFLSKNSITGYSFSTYVIIFFVAIFSQLIGFWSITYAQGYLSANTTSAFLLFQPVITLIFSILFLSKPLENREIIGMIILLMGVYLSRIDE